MGPKRDTSKDIVREIESLYEKMDAMAAYFDKKSARLTNELSEVTQELAETKKELKSTKKELVETKQELNETKQELVETKNELTEAKKELAESNQMNQILVDDNERMKRILNNNSDNSSLPPSIGGGKTKPANTYNSRQATKKKVGAQKGHPGKNLSKAEIEKKIEAKELECSVVEVGTPSKNYVVRYKLDLKFVGKATKYIIYADQNGKYHIPDDLIADVSYGDMIKAIISLLYSEGVVSNDRICDIMNSMSGGTIHMSTGAVYEICRQFSNICQKEALKYEEALLNKGTICTDGTTTTMNGKATYVRNFSSDKEVLYVPLAKKNLDALSSIRLLRSFTGMLVHDHETALYHFGTRHAECNVHLLRYLKKNSEETGNSWSRHLRAFLAGMKRARNDRIEAGGDCFTEAELQRYEERYTAILKEAEKQHITTTGTSAYREEKTLMTRLDKYRVHHLLFLHDFSAPFDNNMSERDLRKVKNRDKMAGGFRTPEGVAMFCNILSVVETLKRKKANLLNGIAALFAKRSVLC